ncbi:MAG: fasciclin [Flavobacteriaceae bacterium]|nr:MAG: fasciclin [Flavobacteriaceae bacterium]
MKSKIIIALMVFAFISCTNEKKEETKSEAKQEVQQKGQSGVAAVEGEQPNVLQVAVSLPDFSTLVVAVQAAGVEDALVNTGPLTVFAPLNSAFAKLPEGTVETLVKPENKETLKMILINHVAPANYPIKQLKKEAKKGRKLYMASGQYLVVENRDGEIYVGGTKILKSVKVSNGWIHVIDDVLVPAE